MNRQRLEMMVTLLDEVAAGTWEPSDMSLAKTEWSKVPEGIPRFDLADWADVDDCGFSACAVGHALLDSRFRDDGFGDEEWGMDPSYNGAIHWRAVKEYFDIGWADVHLMFSAESYPDNEGSASDVAARIRRMLLEAK